MRPTGYSLSTPSLHVPVVCYQVLPVKLFALMASAVALVAEVCLPCSDVHHLGHSGPKNHNNIL